MFKLNIGLNTEEKRTYKLKDRSTQINWIEVHRNKKVFFINEQNLNDLKDNIKNFNIPLIKIVEKEKECRRKILAS